MSYSSYATRFRVVMICGVLLAIVASWKLIFHRRRPSAVVSGQPSEKSNGKVKSLRHPNGRKLPEKSQPVDTTSESRRKYLQSLKELSKGPRTAQLQGRVAMYHRWRTSPKWQAFLRQVALGKVKGATGHDRFLALTYIAGIGHPSRLGPNSLLEWPLENYIRIEQHVRPNYTPEYDVEERHLEIDPKIRSLRVTVPGNKANDLTVQEILWFVVQKYHLKFELRNGNTLHLKQAETKRGRTNKDAAH